MALATIGLGQVTLCSPGLADEFVYPDEWGQAQFALYAWNYLTLPWSVSHGLPVFGLAGEQPIYYLNHPWLASLLLALWGSLFGLSELSVRCCALGLGLVRLGLVALIGRRLGGPRVGLLAAFLFAVAPLSVQLGRVYGMESVHLTFLLGAFHYGLQQRFAPTAVLLALAQASDVYGLFLLPWLLAAAWLHPGQRRLYLGWAGVIGAVQLAVWGYLAGLGLLGESWSKGVGRQHWGLEALRPDYYLQRLRDLLYLTGYLPALLALGSLPGQLRRMSPWLTLGGLQLVICSRWLAYHPYHLLFWTPLIAWLAALTLTRRHPALSLLAGLVTLGLSLAGLRHYLTPQHSHDPEVARQLARATCESDLLLGLPPHMAWYVRRRSMVPYFYFWTAGADETRRQELVRNLVLSSGGDQYRRVVLLTMFVQEEFGRIPPADFSRTEIEGWRRSTPAPGPYLEMWTRKADPRSAPR